MQSTPQMWMPFSSSHGTRSGCAPGWRWIDGIDYTFDDANRPAFIEAIRRYYPDLDETRLQPGYTGIRPKLGDASQANADFRVMGPRDHGEAGVVHLLGIESPGLTASLALAEDVAAMLGKP
jgi:L-2-hydroxyglutarate oxidase LhgO